MQNMQKYAPTSCTTTLLWTNVYLPPRPLPGRKL